MPAGTCKLGTRRNDPDFDSDNSPPFEYRSPGFYIQEYEVTNREMDAFALSHADDVRDPSRADPFRDWKENYNKIKQPIESGGAGPKDAARHPAVSIPWSVADAFASAYQAYLPTEAQWEYAARSGKSGSSLLWSIKEDNEELCQSLAAIDQDADRRTPTYAVGTFDKDKTSLGVRDMIGNVREWCRDTRRKGYRTDGTAAEPVFITVDSPSEIDVAVRGGAFDMRCDARFVTYRGTGYRLSSDPKGNLGFRLVIECPPDEPH